MRNHSTVPDIKAEEYELLVTGAGLRDTTFTLDQLKRMPRTEVTSVIQCNGNRREDYHFIDGKTPAFGPPHWVAGAIANSTWAGVRLRDVLKVAGLDVDSISLGKKEAPAEAVSVALLGSDHDEVGNQYCCSFPFEKAIDPYGDVILAYEMNGADIPRQHGYPVRAIVPGNAGARNCKFLERVTVTDKPCCDSSNWKQYAVHAPDTPLEQLAGEAPSPLFLLLVCPLKGGVNVLFGMCICFVLLLLMLTFCSTPVWLNGRLRAPLFNS